MAREESSTLQGRLKEIKKLFFKRKQYLQSATDEELGIEPTQGSDTEKLASHRSKDGDAKTGDNKTLESDRSKPSDPKVTEIKEDTTPRSAKRTGGKIKGKKTGATPR